MNERKAYTPKEFAALFGKEKTWTYRQLWAGKVKGINNYGRLMISAEEADQIQGHAIEYEGRREPMKEPPPKPKRKAVPPKGAEQWMKWTQLRKCGSAKLKSLARSRDRNQR